MQLSGAGIRREMTSTSPAIDDLVARLRQPLFKYFARRTRVREDAEDLTQEVFVRLSRRNDLGDIGNLESFVFSIAANLLTDFYRQAPRRAIERPIDVQDLDIAANEPDPSRVVEDRQHLDVLLRAIRTLPARRRAVFVMHRFESMSHSAIASSLGISVSAVEKHIAAAVAHLSAQVGGADV
ncbi:MAG: sigma-70 family RNA polymerase sigma factor [Caulobacteraceae bacterium]